MGSDSEMKVALLESHGASFRITNVLRPKPRAGEVLVRIHASGINPLDLKIHAGAAEHARHPLPAVLGIDFAGTVEALGPGVTRFEHGDAVYGMVGGVGGHQGTLAEFAAVDARLLARKPANLSMRQAAALPLIFITAWEGLVDRAVVREGERVLVQGGGGGVGHIVIQLARARGADVFATGSHARRKLIEALGATYVDPSESVSEHVMRHTRGVGFDVVYDTAGGKSLDASFAAIRVFGRVVSSLGWGTHALAPLSFRAGTYSGVFSLLPLLTGAGREHHGEILEEAARLAEAAKVVPRVDDRRFTLETLGQAYEIAKANTAQGKLVVDL